MVNILEAVKGATLEYGRSSMEVDRDLKVKKKLIFFMISYYHFILITGLGCHFIIECPCQHWRRDQLGKVPDDWLST